MTTRQTLAAQPIRPLGVLDYWTAPDALHPQGAVRRDRRVVLDLSDVTFIDAAALGAIVALQNDLIATDRELRLINVHRWQARLFELGGLDSLL